MANTKVQDGKRITVVAGGAVASGDPDIIGSILGIAMNSGVSGDAIEYAVDEVHEIPKLDAAVILQGEHVSFDITTSVIDDKSMTAAAGDLTLCGIAWEGKAATTGETIKVRLTPESSVLN